MAGPERPPEPQEPHEPTPGSIFVRYARLFMGRPRSRASTPATTPVPAAAERTVLDMHKERVAAQVRGFFNAVDARVAAELGFTGNIREELRRRLVPTGPHQHRINTDGLDPALQAHLQHGIFLFSLQDEEERLVAQYRINCQVSKFEPLIWVETHDGFVETSVFTGPSKDEFHTARFRRVFGGERVREITTFTSRSLDPYSPPHPLRVSQGMLPAPHTSMVYDNIDNAGNVQLFDGQTLRDPSGTIPGRYSAADHTITSTLPPSHARPFPYIQAGDHLTIGTRGQQVHFPIQTNLYAELAAISEVVRSIAPE